MAGGFVVRVDQGSGLAELLGRQGAVADGGMGQQLFEPPNVAGWPLGAAWFSTGTMLARTNFAATLAASQKVFLAATLAPLARSPQALLDAMLDARHAGAARLSAAAGADVVPAPPPGPWTGSDEATQHPGRGSCSPPRRLCRVSTRLEEHHGSFSTTFHPPRRCRPSRSGLPRLRSSPRSREAQGIRTRNLVVVYLGGGNDALNTLISYRDAAYYSRRPTIAVPAGQVLQVGTDAAGQALGLHPRLGGLLNIFNEGRLALVQRTGYANSSRSHFEGGRHLGHGQPASSTGSGWLGRYLDTLPRPLDALAAWNTTAETPRALISANKSACRRSRTRHLHASRARTAAPRRMQERTAAQIDGVAIRRPASASRVREQHRARSDRDARSRGAGDVVHADGRVSQQRLRAGVAHRRGRDVRGIGSRVFWLQTGGYDTHAGQGGGGGGGYANLMGTLGDGLWAFYSDLRTRGCRRHDA